MKALLFIVLTKHVSLFLNFSPTMSGNTNFRRTAILWEDPTFIPIYNKP